MSFISVMSDPLWFFLGTPCLFSLMKIPGTYNATLFTVSLCTFNIRCCEVLYSNHNSNEVCVNKKIIFMCSKSFMEQKLLKYTREALRKYWLQTYLLVFCHWKMEFFFKCIYNLLVAATFKKPLITAYYHRTTFFLFRKYFNSF